MSRTLFFLLCSTILCSRSSAQPVPDYGFQWATIGDPGNRDVNTEEFPANTYNIGGVAYEYRITRSKLSVAEHVEFVNAYAQYWTQSPSDPVLTGRFIQPFFESPGVIRYRARPGFENCAADMGWQMAARYCNWLHNGKQLDRASFEAGVYDTSTFRFGGPDGTAQLVPSPGAKVWIPSLSEWTKAVYYDPNRYGPGQGGYWRLPNMSNNPLIMGLPGDGGETIGDLLWQNDPARWLGQWDLGQYPHVQTPWGLIDVSATVPDYTSFITDRESGTLAMGGSLAGQAGYGAFDLGDIFFPGSVDGGTLGSLRIASLVPSTPSLFVFGVGLFVGHKRRRI